jgi:hypothetical protein
MVTITYKFYGLLLISPCHCVVVSMLLHRFVPISSADKVTYALNSLYYMHVDV